MGIIGYLQCRIKSENEKGTSRRADRTYIFDPKFYIVSLHISFQIKKGSPHKLYYHPYPIIYYRIYLYTTPAYTGSLFYCPFPTYRPPSRFPGPAADCSFIWTAVWFAPRTRPVQRRAGLSAPPVPRASALVVVYVRHGTDRIR